MIQILNSPLEVGIRVVAILTSLYPSSTDLTRLVLLDHAVLHSGDFGGLTSLHPQTPVRSGELSIKRELISQGIHLMGSRGLIDRELALAGIYYRASDDALPFLQAFDSTYLTALRLRSAWAASEFSELSDEQIRSQLQSVFGQWAEEFDGDYRRKI